MHLFDYKKDIATQTITSEIKDLISIDNTSIIIGNSDAPVTIHVYYNYQCSACKTFFENTFDIIYTNYIRTDKAHMVLKPIYTGEDEQIINSLKLLFCLNKIGKYETLHQLLLLNNDIVHTPDFINFTQSVLNSNSELYECYTTNEGLAGLIKNNKEFKQLKMNTSPVFIINNSILKGAYDYSTFDKIIKNELKQSLGEP